MLFLCNGIFVFASSLLGPLYAIYVQHLGKGVLTISFTSTVFLLATTLFTVALSRFKDGWVRKEHFLIAGFLIRAVVWITFLLITNITELVVLQILLGAGEALGNSSFDAVFAEHLDKNLHVAEYADWQIIMNVLTATATFIGGILMTLYGFSILFITMSSFALISSLILALKPKNILMN